MGSFFEGSWFGSFPAKIPTSIVIFSVLTARITDLLRVRVSGQYWALFAAVCLLHGTTMPRVCGSQWTASGFSLSCFFSRNFPGVNIADLMPYGSTILRTIYLTFNKFLNLSIPLTLKVIWYHQCLCYGPILMTLFI